MKKILLMTALAAFAYFGAVAQDAPGKSTYGQSHKKAKKTKKAKKQYSTTTQNADRKTINTRHRTAVRAATENDVLTNDQQRDQIKQANVTHKQEIKAARVVKPTGKNK